MDQRRNLQRKWKKTVVRHERLKQARERRGLTQEELARRIKLSGRQISDRESHDGGMTSNSLVLIARELEVSIDWLCGLTDDIHGHQQRTLSEDENRMLVALRDFDLLAARRVVRDVFTRRGTDLVNDAFPEDDTLYMGGEEPKH